MILQFIFLLFTSLFHPLHLSISELVLNPKNGNLEISHRIFIDDLEADLKERSGQSLDLIKPKDAEKARALVGNYIEQHFKLQVNGKSAKPQYLGYEVEEDAIWVYMEVPGVRKLKEVQVQNTLFFKRFTDQLNLINVNVGGQIQSLKLEADQPTGHLRFK